MLTDKMLVITPDINGPITSTCEKGLRVAAKHYWINWLLVICSAIEVYFQRHICFEGARRRNLNVHLLMLTIETQSLQGVMSGTDHEAARLENS